MRAAPCELAGWAVCGGPQQIEMMSPSNQQHYIVHSILNTHGFYRLPMHVLAFILKLLEVEHSTNPKVIQQNTIVGLLKLVPDFDPEKENFFTQPKHLMIEKEIRVYLHAILKDLVAQLKVTPPQTLTTPALPISTFSYSGINYPPYYPTSTPEMLQQMQMMYYRSYGMNQSLGLISSPKPFEKEKESSNEGQKKEAIYHQSQEAANQMEENRRNVSEMSEKSMFRVKEKSNSRSQQQEKMQQKKERFEGDSRIIFETSNAPAEKDSIIVEDFHINSVQNSVKVEQADVVPMQPQPPNNCCVDVQTDMTLTEDDLIINIRDMSILPKKPQKVEKKPKKIVHEVYNPKPTQSRGRKKLSPNANNLKDKNEKEQKPAIVEEKLKEQTENPQKEQAEKQVQDAIEDNHKSVIENLLNIHIEKVKENEVLNIENDNQIQRPNEQQIERQINEKIRQEINEDIQREQEEFNMKMNQDQLDYAKQSKCQEQNFLRVPLSNEEEGLSHIQQPCDIPSQHVSQNIGEEDLLSHEKLADIDHEIEQIKPIEPSPEDIERESMEQEEERRILERERELFEERLRQMAREREAEKERERLEEQERLAEMARQQEIERQNERKAREQMMRQAEEQKRRLKAEWDRIEQQRILEQQRQEQLIRQEERRKMQLVQAEQRLKRQEMELLNQHVKKYKSCICEGKCHFEDVYSCSTCSNFFHWQCFNLPPVQERIECLNCRLRKMDPLCAVKDVIGEYYITDIAVRKFSACLNFQDYAFIREKSHRNHQIQIRCFRIDHQIENSDITWPDECIISLNDQKISELYALRANSLLKKRKDYPITLPNFKIFNDETAEDNYRNIRISLEVRHQGKLQAAQKRINNTVPFLFGIYCVKKITVDALYQQIMEKEIQYCPETYLTDLIEGLSLEKEVFRLVDPYAWTQIVTPVRGLKCNHGQCFDLKAYLTFMAGMTNRNWRCPICLQQTKAFRFDSIINQLIKRFEGTDQLPAQVSALADGSFILKMMIGDDESSGDIEKKSKRERKAKKMQEKAQQKQARKDDKIRPAYNEDGEMRPALIKQEHIDIENQSEGDEYMLPSKNKKQIAAKNKKSYKGKKLQENRNRQ